MGQINSTVCDNPAPLTDFNAQAYMGTWYEINRVPWEPFQPKTETCVQAQYSNLNTSTGTFTVTNSSQNKSFDPRVTFTG